MYLPIRGKLLDTEGLIEMMVDDLWVDLEVIMKEFEATRGVHAKFRFLENVYTYELLRAM